MDEKTLAILIPAIVGLISSLSVIILTKKLSSRQEQAKAESDEGEAAESLSAASRTLVETYNKELIVPMQKRIEELVGQISVIEEDRHDEKLKLQGDIKVLQDQVTDLLRQVSFMRGELKRADTALEYLVGLLQSEHPNETMQAVRIRRGEIT